MKEPTGIRRFHNSTPACGVVRGLISGLALVVSVGAIGAQGPATGGILIHPEPGAYAGFETGGEELICDHFADKAVSTADASIYLAEARADPTCTRVGVDTFRLTLGVLDPEVRSVRMKTSNQLTYGGVLAPTIELYDDGTHGDEHPGDQTFTIDQMGIANPLYPMGHVAFRDTELTFYYSGKPAQTIRDHLGLKIDYIHSDVPIPQVATLAQDVIRTSHVVNIVRPLAGEFPLYQLDLMAVSQRFYEFFPDDVNFMVAIQVFNRAPGYPNAAYGNVMNDTEGIGFPQSNLTAFYGSEGVLNGIAKLYYGDVLTKFLNHEILHRWASYLDSSLDLKSPSNHWGAVERDSTGFGGREHYTGAYDHLEQVEGDTYRGWQDDNITEGRYSDLELYLMGLLDFSEVAFPIRTLVNPVFLRYEAQGGVRYSVFSASGLRDVERAEFLAAEGERSPQYPDTQKSFRAALIAIYDRPLTPVELAPYDFVMKEYEKSYSGILGYLTFEAATGGRGSIQTHLEVNYSLIVSAENGMVNLSSDQPSYEYGTEVVLTAVPDDGYQFQGWTGDIPTGQENANPLTLTMDWDKTVRAEFTQRKVAPHWVFH